MFIDQDLVAEKAEVVKEIHRDAQKAYLKQLEARLLTEILPKDADGQYLIIDWKK